VCINLIFGLHNLFINLPRAYTRFCQPLSLFRIPEHLRLWHTCPSYLLFEVLHRRFSWKKIISLNVFELGCIFLWTCLDCESFHTHILWVWGSRPGEAARRDASGCPPAGPTQVQGTHARVSPCACFSLRIITSPWISAPTVDTPIFFDPCPCTKWTPLRF